MQLTTLKATVAAAFALTIAAAWVIGSAHAPPYILPSPQKVGEAAIRFFSSPRQLAHLAATLTHISVSIAISFVAGSILALLAHYATVTSPLVHQRISPFLNAFSGIGWTLLAVIWFGVSTPTVIFSISLVLLPFAIVNLREGLVSLDRELDEMSRSFGRGGWRLFTLIVLPALIPFAAATLRIMFGVAWKVALTAELFGGSSSPRKAYSNRTYRRGEGQGSPPSGRAESGNCRDSKLLPGGCAPLSEWWHYRT